MQFDLLLHDLLDLGLPSLEIHFACLQRAIDAYTQSQGMLMLPGERHQALVAKHRTLFLKPSRENDPQAIISQLRRILRQPTPRLIVLAAKPVYSSNAVIYPCARHCHETIPDSPPAGYAASRLMLCSNHGSRPGVS